MNRKVNCETANINKTVSAAVKAGRGYQVYPDITMWFRQIIRWTEERVAILYAWQHPDATLKELGRAIIRSACGEVRGKSQPEKIR